MCISADDGAQERECGARGAASEAGGRGAYLQVSRSRGLDLRLSAARSLNCRHPLAFRWIFRYVFAAALESPATAGVRFSIF